MVRKITIGLLITYALIQLTVMLSLTRISDEDWFYNIADSIGHTIHAQGWVRTVLSQPNLLGYGSGYWIIYGTASALTRHAFLVMRLLAWLSYLLVPIMVLIHAKVNRQSHGLLALLVWFSMAAAWWTGKLTGPDLYIVGLAAIALHLTTTWKYRLWWTALGWVLLGYAIGLRFNVLPIAVYAGVLTIFTTIQTHRRYFLLAIPLITAFGFILANPIILSDIISYVANVRNVREFTSVSSYTWSHFVTILYSNSWTWDTIFSGGFFQIALNPVALILFVIYACVGQISWKQLTAGALTWLAAIFLLLSNAIFYGWYWLPIVIVIPFLILAVPRREKLMLQLGSILIVCMFVTTIPIVARSYYHTWEHHRLIKQQTDVQNCINDNGAVIGNIDLIVKFIDPGLQLDFTTLGSVPSHDPLPAFVWLETGFVSATEQRIVVFSSAHMQQVHTLGALQMALTNPYTVTPLFECDAIQAWLLEAKK